MMRVSKYVVTKYFARYSTTPTVTVYNPTVAVLYITLVTTAFFMYFSSIDFKVQKLYQRECPVQGITLTYVDGKANTKNLSDAPAKYRKKWDIEELLFPAYGGEGETGSFTIVTNMRITENQTRGVCPGDSGFLDCKQDDDCKEGIFKSTGTLTGKCNQETATCEIEDWCPTEASDLPSYGGKPLLEDVKNFIVILRSIVEFPKCGGQQGYNALIEDILDRCMYDPVKHPYCPKFQIGDIVKRSKVDFMEVAYVGNVFRIRIKWDCDLDFGRTASDCAPTYAFSTVKDEDGNGYTGWSFQSPIHHPDGTRTLRTMYAFKFLISIEGKGRKFHFFTFIINLGASTGLLFVAPFVCDLILSLFEKCGKSGRVSAKQKSLPVDASTIDKTASQATVVQME